MNEDAVFRLKHQVVLRVVRKCFLKIHAENLQLAIARATEYLRVVELSIRSGTTRQIDCNPQPCGAVGEMVSWITYLAADGYHRGILEVVAPKYSDGVKGLQSKVLFLAFQRVRQ